MRTATTDEHARRWFRRSWTFGVGPGAHILVHALLEMIRESAEGARPRLQGRRRHDESLDSRRSCRTRGRAVPLAEALPGLNWGTQEQRARAGESC